MWFSARGGLRMRQHCVVATGVLMSILTGRELEFLVSLKTSWKRLYCNELARLLNEAATPCEAEAGSIAYPRHPEVRRASSRLGGQVLLFRPETRKRETLEA